MNRGLATNLKSQIRNFKSKDPIASEAYGSRSKIQGDLVTWLRRHMPSASVRFAVIYCNRYKPSNRKQSLLLQNIVELILLALCRLLTSDL
jgi:hypothetical protein